MIVIYSIQFKIAANISIPRAVPDFLGHAIYDAILRAILGLPLSIAATVTHCGTLRDPTNGRVIISGTTVYSTATYQCDSGYSISGTFTRVCRNNGEWSGTAPTCKRESRQSSSTSALLVLLISNLY